MSGSWDDYNTALKRIALKTEATGVTLGAFLAQDPPPSNVSGGEGCVRLPALTTENPTLTTRCRSCIIMLNCVVRGVDAHNCATLFANAYESCRRKSTSSSPGSGGMVDYNLDTPVSRLTFPEAN